MSFYKKKYSKDDGVLFLNITNSLFKFLKPVLFLKISIFF